MTGNATATTPLLHGIGPPLISNYDYERLPERLSSMGKPESPLVTFTKSRPDDSGKCFPQAIAHRGYKMKYPENTMVAFEGAVKAGANALETDIHLSRDGVVVLAHDATLKRCFSIDKKVIDCDWSFLRTLHTTEAPHVHMPRLQDLLEYLTLPGLEDIWVILDIKLDNDTEQVMKLIASTIEAVPPGTKPWNQRVVLGCWATKYIPLRDLYLPHFLIAHIGFSIPYARQFFATPNVAFSMLGKILMGPRGKRFIRDVRSHNRELFAWTINSEEEMKWCIKNELDGVLTDDIDKYMEVRKRFSSGTEESKGFSILALLNILRVNFLAYLLSFIFQWRFGLLDGIDRKDQTIDQKH
ncbi:PLC-like phosphodiesterase [Xylona heveae TC161]|uniref:PLC-like phosphodiesterase n=1 Tax=Xylona heveae (strain CBS 132557 / TC161) TaxID=1328760 RepID=A0A165HID8_XYLHT|nr:PLC-like phosphodiesterase [Xylona heveae TC161]KZF23564.1 PLC-like phosphodiesterase [Xylona heveae TC161]